MTRVMILMHNTPMQFWVEAINIACYTANRIFLQPGTKKTSYELWTRTNLTLNILVLLVVSATYSRWEEPWKV